jgi:hypothetical protein
VSLASIANRVRPRRKAQTADSEPESLEQFATPARLAGFAPANFQSAKLPIVRRHKASPLFSNCGASQSLRNSPASQSTPRKTMPTLQRCLARCNCCIFVLPAVPHAALRIAGKNVSLDGNSPHTPRPILHAPVRSLFPGGKFPKSFRTKDYLQRQTVRRRRIVAPVFAFTIASPAFPVPHPLLLYF